MTRLDGKKLKRLIEMGGKDVVVALSAFGISFRLPKKRGNALVSWKQVLDLYARCGNINRPLRGVLGLWPRVVESRTVEQEKGLDYKELAKAVNKKLLATEKKNRGLKEEAKALKKKIRRAVKALGDK